MVSLLARSSVLQVNEEAEELAGGNASESVLRVGDTVRKPWLENSATVQKYLKALQVAGLDVPNPLGKDHAGRHVTEYVEGVSALDQLPLAVLTTDVGDARRGVVT